MRLTRGHFAVLAVCVAVAGCGGKKEPKGQVVAVVDGQEVTRTELRAEMAGVNVTDPKARKEIERAALQSIVNRKLLADAAREEKIDKLPAFTVQRDRTMDALLVQAYQAKLADAVPQPSREEAQKFMAANPHVFAERKLFQVDQIRMARPTDAGILERFKPLKTMEEVEALLRAEGVDYRRGADRIDAVGSDPKIVAEVMRLPAGEVFVIPGPQMIMINRIQSSTVLPFTGEPAVRYAQDLIRNQRRGEAVAKQFNRVVAQGGEKVRYGKGYEPPKPAGAPAQKTAKAS